MKFKYIVIIFNIIIVFFLSAVALVPVFAFGSVFAVNFWQSSWPLILILFAALIGLNVFFLSNHRLFILLEREDWPALVDYLEQKVFRQGHYAPRYVRLLINSYLVLSDSAAVLRLENRIAVARPALVRENALVFGAARILGGDVKGAVDFFELRLEESKAAAPRSAGGQWLRWYYGFSLVLDKQYARAEGELKNLAASSADALVAGLSAYVLGNILVKFSDNGAGCRTLAQESRERIKGALKNAGGWKKEAAKAETEVYAAIIKQYIEQAGAWIFE